MGSQDKVLTMSGASHLPLRVWPHDRSINTVPMDNPGYHHRRMVREKKKERESRVEYIGCLYACT